MSATATTDAGPDETPPALIFHWGRRTRVHWRLGLMILISLLAHAASFYVLQIAYTPTGSLLPPPARVVLVPLDQPENAALARWLSLADPTLAIESPAAPPDAVLDSLGFGYVPSYEAMPPAFKLLDPVISPESIAAPPRSMTPGPVATTDVPVGKAGSTAESRTLSAPLLTRVVLSGAISGIAPVPLPPARFPGNPGRKAVEPTIFLVGIRPEGGAPFLFPVRQAPATSASADVDEANEFARDYLARLKFLPPAMGDGNAVWGRATFYWGNGSAAGAN